METQIGIRAFQQDLAEYINNSSPVTITCHGQTVGYFLPAQKNKPAAGAAVLREGAALDAVLADQQVNIEEIVQECKQLRKKARANALLARHALSNAPALHYTPIERFQLPLVVK